MYGVLIQGRYFVITLGISRKRMVFDIDTYWMCAK